MEPRESSVPCRIGVRCIMMRGRRSPRNCLRPIPPSAECGTDRRRSSLPGPVMTTRSRNRLVTAFRRLVRYSPSPPSERAACCWRAGRSTSRTCGACSRARGRGRGRRPRVRGRDLVERGVARPGGPAAAAGGAAAGRPVHRDPRAGRIAAPGRSRFPNCSGRSARASAGRSGRCGGSIPATARSAAATSGTTPTSGVDRVRRAVAATHVRAGRRASRPRLVLRRSRRGFRTSPATRTSPGRRPRLARDLHTGVRLPDHRRRRNARRDGVLQPRRSRNRTTTCSADSPPSAARSGSS